MWRSSNYIGFYQIILAIDRQILNSCFLFKSNSQRNQEGKTVKCVLSNWVLSPAFGGNHLPKGWIFKIAISNPYTQPEGMLPKVPRMLYNRPYIKLEIRQSTMPWHCNGREYNKCSKDPRKRILQNQWQSDLREKFLSDPKFAMGVTLRKRQDLWFLRSRRRIILQSKSRNLSCGEHLKASDESLLSLSPRHLPTSW